MTQPSLPARLALVAAAIVAALVTVQGVPVRVPKAQTPAATGDRIVVGQLVDGLSGRPVSSALVTLTSGAAPAPGGPGRGQPAAGGITLRAFTDDAGRFMFHSLPVGSYALTATLTSYLPAAYGQTRASGSSRRLELAAGQRVTNMTMKIWKEGAIAGTVRDESGDPSAGVRVQLVTITGGPARRRYAVQWSKTTDDRGHYQFQELQPGDYLINVPLMVTSIPVETAAAFLDGLASRDRNRVSDDVRSSGGTMTTAGFQVGDQLIQASGGQAGVPSPLLMDGRGRMLVYPPAFYPGVPAVAAATIVALGPGEHRDSLDFAVKPVAAFRVSGVVQGQGGPVPNMTVKIMPAGVEAQIGTPSIGPEIGMAVTRADGTFTALGIPAGRYVASVVRTAAPPSVDGPAPTDLRLWWARTPVVVADADVTRVELHLADGATVSGRVEFEPGAIAAPASAVIGRTRVLLQSWSGVAGERFATAPVNADGTFTSAAYVPGQYQVSVVSVAPPGWTLKDVNLGGRDVTGEPIDLGESGVRGLVFTYTDKAGELSGAVAKSARDGDVVVYLVPVDARAPGQVRARLLRRVAAEADGSYRFTAVLPGEHIVAAALFDAGAVDPEDPQAIATLVRRGTRITVGDREKRSQDLSLIRIRQP